jgi:hypothetical protein
MNGWDLLLQFKLFFKYIFLSHLKFFFSKKKKHKFLKNDYNQLYFFFFVLLFFFFFTLQCLFVHYLEGSQKQQCHHLKQLMPFRYNFRPEYPEFINYNTL